jgi:N-acetylglucosaminyl-diphospho-decaprenol L-rhamnosyltransferase
LAGCAGGISLLVDLSIVIVSWNVKELLERCLSSLTTDGLEKSRAVVARRPRLEREIIVVDNASSDGSSDMVREQYAHVRLIASASNLGFARANNRGVAASTGRYILLLNPDTEVLGGTLAGMVTYMDQHPDIGILGPKLLWPDGQVQPSRRRFPTLTTAFLESTMLQEWFPHSRVLQRYYIQDKSDDGEQDVDWLVGACLLIRREVWEQVGPLDENLFMYSEELDWCHRAKTAGWRVVYVPWATVVHHEGQSSSQVVPARHIYFQSSKVYYFRKYHGLVAGETLRLFLLGTYAFQLVLEAAKWAVGHKRALRQQRVAAYMCVLRSGLCARGEYALTPTLPQGEPGANP